MKLLLIASLAISGLWGSTILTVRGLSGAVATEAYVALGSAECYVLDALPPTGGSACEARSFVNQAGLEVPDWLVFGGWHINATFQPASLWLAGNVGEVISLTPSGVGLIPFSIFGRHEDGRRIVGDGVVAISYHSDPMAPGGPWGAVLVFSELSSQPGEVLVSQSFATPEPVSFMLTGLGFIAIVVARRRGR